MTYRLIQGDNRQILKQFPDNHFDSIVTDPPYGIDFLGKAWDANTGALDTYQECLRVLKPGGHIFAFSAARTYHHLAITLEQAGFEIRDQIMWIYSSGFPKSQDVGKNNDMPDWAGWGTALKPAHEPIALARKPIKTSIAKNVEKYGTGALNIDATRIPYADGQIIKGGALKVKMDEANSEVLNKTVIADNTWTGHSQGRFPSNVIGEITEPYQKYFYCPKVSRRERHTGESENNHPTVKPVALMEYLIKLITPPNGLVLDPFNGSGSTGMAAVGLGMDYIGIDLDPNYIEISKKRIDAWYALQNPNLFKELFEDAVN